MRDINVNDWGAFLHCHAARGEMPPVFTSRDVLSTTMIISSLMLM